jgi:hypothetical protein
MLMRIVFIFWGIIHFSCTDSNQGIPIRDVYDFINAFLRRTSPPHFSDIKILSDREVLNRFWNYSAQDSLNLISRDSLFSKEDVHLIFQQAQKMNSFKLDDKYIENKKIVTLDALPAFTDATFWNKFQNQFGADKFATISLPLFSKDKALVIVRVNYYTSFGGGGGVFLFKKLNGNWDLLDQLTFWDN